MASISRMTTKAHNAHPKRRTSEGARTTPRRSTSCRRASGGRGNVSRRAEAWRDPSVGLGMLRRLADGSRRVRAYHGARLTPEGAHRARGDPPPQADRALPRGGSRRPGTGSTRGRGPRAPHLRRAGGADRSQARRAGPRSTRRSDPGSRSGDHRRRIGFAHGPESRRGGFFTRGPGRGSRCCATSRSNRSNRARP